MSNLEFTRAERLDQYVLRHLPQLTRTYAAKLITDGKVTVNGQVQLKPGSKPRTGESIEIEYDSDLEYIIPKIELDVIYEDHDCVVIRKPAGILTHSKGAFNPEGTVASWLRLRLAGFAADEPAPNGNARAGIVHRLDRATSGVMICAKTPEAMTWLQKQFSQRKVKKTYRAIVAGHFEHTHATIVLPLQRNPKKPATFRVDANGKSAVTDYFVIAESPRYTDVGYRPATGRTHQLRVHSSYLRHPIVGDVLYGGEPADRMLLHAYSLELTLPDRSRQVFYADVPDEFDDWMRADA